MAKPVFVTFPFVLFLIDWWPLQRLHRAQMSRLIIEKIPLFVLAATISIVTYCVQTQHNGFVDQTPFFLRLENAAISYVLYLRDMVYFSDLSVYYAPVSSFPMWQPVLSAIALLSVCVFLFVLLRKNVEGIPPVLAGWLWFLGTLVPMIGLVQSGYQSRADRFTYIPAIGIAISIVWGFGGFFAEKISRPLFTVLTVILMLGALTKFTIIRIHQWQNPTEMVLSDLSLNQNNWFLHAIAAESLSREGRYEESLAQFQICLQQKPQAHEPHNGYGTLLAKLGRLNDALEQFRTAHQLDPENPMYSANVARAQRIIQKATRPPDPATAAHAGDAPTSRGENSGSK